MKVLCVLLSLAAITTGAPSTGGEVYGGGGLFGLFGPWVGFAKTIQTFPFRPTQVLSEKLIEVEVPPPPPPAPAKKTVYERTVIPQYVEKRIQVPTYIEKTIRVPTYVQRTITVPVAPTIVEKEISHEEFPNPKHKKRSVSAVRPITAVGVDKFPFKP